MTGPARILVVDDEPDVEALIRQRFRKAVRAGEKHFLFAGNGEEALDVLAREAVDVVLSDINMPRMDGLTLLERLAERDLGIQTVIVSAYGDMRNLRTAMNRGAFDFVTKPIEFEDLEATLEKTLRHLRLMRRLAADKAAAERAHATLSRFFSPSVIEALSSESDALAPHAERREATFLFTDLESFTPLAESLDAERIVSVLNGYLSGLTAVIFENGGTVMKIIGDSIHATFGAPMPQADHAARALACAHGIDAFAERFRRIMAAEGVTLGATRIGINSGEAMIGNFGGDGFFDFTAFGDAVNVASRLEQANKIIGTRICVSESVVERCPDFHGRPIGQLLLKGKSRAVRCFEPQARDAEVTPADYASAYALLEAGEPSARQAFAALLAKQPDDPVTLFHLGRLLKGATGTEIDLLAG